MTDKDFKASYSNWRRDRNTASRCLLQTKSVVRSQACNKAYMLRILYRPDVFPHSWEHDNAAVERYSSFTRWPRTDAFIGEV